MRKHIIIAESRTGSTLLHRALNQHENIRNHNEPLYWKKSRAAFEAKHGREFFKGIYEVDWPVTKIETLGVKIFRANLEECKRFGQDLIPVIHDLRMDVIYLRRVNLLHSYVSKQVAMLDGKNMVAGPYSAKAVNKLVIDEDQFLNHLRVSCFRERKVEGELAGLRLHKLTYEDLVSGWPGSLQAAHRFLGVVERPVDMPARKQFVYRYEDYDWYWQARELAVKNGFAARAGCASA